MTYDDEFAGQGGSYILDPQTGKRTLVHRTVERDAPAPAEPEKAQEQPPQAHEGAA